jgi:hypothetical protein
MARPLTAKLVETIKPNPKKRVEIPDGAVVGLYLVIQKSGARSWAVRCRVDGAPRRRQRAAKSTPSRKRKIHQYAKATQAIFNTKGT